MRRGEFSGICRHSRISDAGYLYMGHKNLQSDEQSLQLAAKACQGDDQAARDLFEPFYTLVVDYIELRMDDQLRSQVDADDIWQETLIEATNRLEDYLDRKPMPFRVWMLKTAQKHLGRAREKHLVRQRRDLRRNVPIPDRSSMALAKQLIRFSSPSQAAMKREHNQILADVIARLDANDREILLLRHIQHIDFPDIAELLEISYASARQRHVRALVRLRNACERQGIDLEAIE